ncbi:helix-turn-helix domain-containing protein [Nocardia terpenica]|uniref:helix-turn-helix transcriptional regulator n=1 Tax=Nocardia terpenica TaxID=455432 RepID=UPI001895AB4D|nr:helix-turn-helix transcriptional regulator [Nocardia terpenica]MBF6066262.1 helix-turn-helix domain-containing protein [Nocardia terpenica]MBF6109318.1 helix-turn-helix domain-containing protein [Nocardia terpenica]MBF6116560.1 helix-turn-helix domain-containing protein [Nocardia terpenica]MBF6123619.1 helix-turn-helix domain-containing protein [Nocardia terpenica]MBF6156952.1 helix-turn-helix domain-containing protein [Nocardia terpenica]
MTVDRRAELGEFLRSRRARLRPEEVGLIDHGTRRRVPGLRREELALLAGVSVDHYVRLEQGRTLQFSESVLDAVARALRLNPVEREHFYRLARPWSGEETPADQQVRPGLRRLLDSTGDVPAYIVGRGTRVLAWNRLAAALVTDFAALDPLDRNLARLVFLDEGMRELYEDWDAKAADVVAYLRLDLSRNPGCPVVSALIDELSGASPEFREHWSRHELKDKTHGRYVYIHPEVGRLELSYETLRLPDDPDQALIAHTVEPGSPSETALRLLASLSEPARR